MNRLLLLAVLLVGCSKADVSGIEPFVAVTGHYSIMASSTSAPKPPAPVVGDECPSCYGRGIVGDGTNMVKCQACGGTGKRKVPASTTAPCTSGTCTTRVIVR